jgi:DNA invertase Pin-like site-specific DNA recombinase
MPARPVQKPARPAAAKIAFSYIRFSHPDQARGDSVRRQTARTDDWCKRNGAVLDTSLSLTDAGRSAYDRDEDSFDTYALAAFLKLVKGDRVPRDGSAYLVVENLDRLSRETEVVAFNRFTSILMERVNIVQLSPREQVFARDSDLGALLPAILELSRGHSESKAKSDRVGPAWAQKRAEAGRGVPMTRKLPGWITLDGVTTFRGKAKDGKLVLIEERAAVVRRIFALAAEGRGVHAIARLFNDEGVPCWRRPWKRNRPGPDQPDVPAPVWNETAIYFILASRAVFGEFQPCKGSRTRGHKKPVPAGEPIANYFPPVVTPEQFWAAQAALAGRRRPNLRGRRGKHLNLFAGLLRDARDGGSMTYQHLAKRSAIIIPVGAKQGTGVTWSSFPVKEFEESIRARLVEITAADVFDRGAPGRRVEALAGELAHQDRLIAKLQPQLDNPDLVDLVSPRLAIHNRKRKELATALAQAQREAANPAAESWGEFRALGGLDPEQDTDEVRQKVRAALRRCVQSIHCLFTTRTCGARSVRVAAVRVQFLGVAAHRDYLIALARRKRPAILSRPGQPGPAYDLRRPKEAAKLLRWLEADPVAGQLIAALVAEANPELAGG